MNMQRMIVGTQKKTTLYNNDYNTIIYVSQPKHNSTRNNVRNSNMNFCSLLKLCTLRLHFAPIMLILPRISILRVLSGLRSSKLFLLVLRQKFLNNCLKFCKNFMGNIVLYKVTHFGQFFWIHAKRDRQKRVKVSRSLF